jgi:hypothetical protein
MEGIIEYIDVKYNKQTFIKAFNDVAEYEPHSYIECGATSHVLKSNSDYYEQWSCILDQANEAHMHMCEHGTGFNFSPTIKHNVPPHIDFDDREGGQFNLLLPLFGAAKISIYETIPEQLEYRHGMKHWNMLQNKYPPNKIGEIIVDKPVLLNTAYLHDVQVVESPRAIFCIAWRGVNKTYKEFKDHVKEIYS